MSSNFNKRRRLWFKNKRKKNSQNLTSQKVTAPEEDESKVFQLHGYMAFKLYFMETDSIDVDNILKNVSAFEKYIRKNISYFCFDAIKSNKIFFIDWDHYKDYIELENEWSNFKTDLISNTKQSLACMGLAMHQIISTTFKIKEDSFIEENVSNSMKIPYIQARIVNYKPIEQLRNIKVNYYNNLVSLRGTIIKASNIRLLCKYMAFKCSSCTGTQLVSQIDGNFTPPTRCPTKGCRSQSNFLPLLNHRTHTVNWQTIKMQELSALDSNENGRIPRTIECELYDELVGCCIPGDDVTITGVIKVQNKNEVRNRKNQPSVFSLLVEVISIVNNKNESEANGGIGERITFNTKDYYAIQQIHAQPELFRFLVHSLCPNIYGNELVKAGFLLALFGGTNDSTSELSFTRAVSHVLIVGDPGLGKSHMLQACANVAPRGVFVCGNTSTSSGLTVTMTKESNGDYSLEAGALILADQGCCCIDEFDKMTSQHAYLLEAMEQQSISIAKAGVTCSLSACTSILAAANPAGGHYNKAKTVAENIKMSSPLISRFDLIFLLLDQPCQQRDRLLSEHILALHSGRKGLSFQLADNNSQVKDDVSLFNRLKLPLGEIVDHLPHQLFRKYIAYAQKYVHPTVSEEAQAILRQFYLDLRKNCQANGNWTPITARQLESLLRLTQARAKAELREEATLQDAMDVIEIMKHSLVSVYTNEAGTLDFQRSQNGSGMSKQGQIKKLLVKLQENAESLTQSVFSTKELQEMAEFVGIGKESFYDTLQKLNLHGYLIKKSSNKYQLTSVDYV